MDKKIKANAAGDNTTAQESAAELLLQVSHLEREASVAARELRGAQEMLNEKEQSIDNLLNSLGEGILAVDTNENLVFMNVEAQEILGLDFAECAGMNLAVAIRERDFGPRLADTVHRAGSSQSSLNVLSISRESGEARHYIVSISDFRDAAGLRIGKIIKLIDNTATLESERLREFFLSAVAHELRTPVTTVKNYVSILRLRQWGTQDYQEILGDMQTAADRLMRLVNNTVMLSSLSTAHYAVEYSAVDVGALVEALVCAARTSASEKNVRISVDNRLAISVICTDRKLLDIAAGCLLSNAIKFNKQSGSVTITLDRAKRDGRTVFSLSFANTGAGIREELRTNLLRGFIQGEDPLTRSNGGIGIGLFLTRRVAELLGGNLDIASVAGEGSTVTLSFPLHE